jgi:hypothetical protein
MMSNACRRHHIGHSTMCTTATRKKRVSKKEKTTQREREKEQMRIELPLGISISSFYFLSPFLTLQ